MAGTAFFGMRVKKITQLLGALIVFSACWNSQAVQPSSLLNLQRDRHNVVIIDVPFPNEVTRQELAGHQWELIIDDIYLPPDISKIRVYVGWNFEKNLDNSSIEYVETRMPTHDLGIGGAVESISMDITSTLQRLVSKELAPVKKITILRVAIQAVRKPNGQKNNAKPADLTVKRVSLKKY